MISDDQLAVRLWRKASEHGCISPQLARACVAELGKTLREIDRIVVENRKLHAKLDAWETWFKQLTWKYGGVVLWGAPENGFPFGGMAGWGSVVEELPIPHDPEAQEEA